MMQLMVPGGALLMAAAYSVRHSSVDLWILGLSGAAILVSGIFWTGFDLGKSRDIAVVLPALIFSPLIAYPIGVILGFRYFFTPVTGPVKTLYLVSGIVCLLPIFALLAIGAMMALGTKH